MKNNSKNGHRTHFMPHFDDTISIFIIAGRGGREFEA
jgi:hypothetical protein